MCNLMNRREQEMQSLANSTTSHVAVHWHFAMKTVSNLRKTILNMSITLLIYSMCQLFCKSI